VFNIFFISKHMLSVFSIIELFMFNLI
jgi:hypothetical protein